MSLNVSSWSIRNPTPSVLLFVLLTLAGLMGFSAMRVQNFPDMDLPVVTVTASMPGASPSQLETDVARKLENALSAVQGVKHITSTLTDGSAIVSVEFRLEKPLQEAVDEVRDAVAGVRGDLPAELRDPVIRKNATAGSPILTYTVASSRLDEEALSWFVDQQVAKTLLAVPGVGSLLRVGGLTREVRVELDPARLLALQISAADVSRQLRQVQQQAAAGRADLGGSEQPVRTIATVHSAAELAAVEIVLSSGRSIRLDQVAHVVDGAAEPRTAALLDGKPVVAFEVTRARRAGELEVAAAARVALQQLLAEHPGVDVVEAVNAIDPVRENYQGSMGLLYEGAALAVLVVFVFLRDWRSTFVAAVALPLSAIPAFAVMHLLGFTLNTVSLLSLSLVVGVLVDDAIVEIENIARHLRMGKTPFQAAMEAADEIGLAVIATTFTLVAVFLPTAFMDGIVGKVFIQFGWTAAIAVFFSLVVARMLTPMMLAYLLKPPANPRQGEPRWIEAYLGWARWCLRRRGLTLAFAGLFLGLGLVLAGTLPGAFIPPDDSAQTQVSVTLPPGSTLQDTLNAAERVREILLRNEYTRTVYTAVGGRSIDTGPGGDGPGASNVRNATLTANLADRASRGGVTQQQIEQQFRDAMASLPGVRIKVGSGGSGEAYALVLMGEDDGALMRAAAQVERELRTIPGIGAVTSSAGLVQAELVARPDFARAADLGVTSAAIAETLRVATTGDHEQALAKLDLGERQVPVVVRLPAAARQDIETLKQLPVPGARGPVALENVATLEIGSAPTEITRRDRSRHVSLEVELNGRPLGDVEQAALALPSVRKLPPGVKLAPSGEAADLTDLVRGFAIATLTGVLCIYIVLVLLFESFVQPLTILMALVLSVPGAFVALAVTGSALSMASMIGLIMLMGIATKNSILLVDYAVIARQQQHGLARIEAVVDACRKRARPIVMTTLAMGAGMLPVALGWGGDPSFRSPMAIVVIGGLLSSTVLSLLVVPVVITCVDDLMAWLRGLFPRNKGPVGAVAPAASPVEGRDMP